MTSRDVVRHKLVGDIVDAYGRYEQPMSIDVVNETEADIDIASIGQQARFVLDRLRVHAGAELSVLRGHRHHDRPARALDG